MTRKTRIWLIVLAVPLVLVLAAAITLKLMFTSERLKGMIIPRAEEATGRRVGIDNISLGLFPAIALEMDDLTVSNRRGEGFSDSPFLSLESLRASVRLLPLLSGRIEVTSFEIDGPHLLLEVNRKNQTNYADLTGAEAAPGDGDPGSAGPGAGRQDGGQPPSAPPSSAALLVPDLRVKRGVIEYVSYPDDYAVRLRGVAISTSMDVRGDSVFVSGHATSESFSYGTVTIPLLDGLRAGIHHGIVYNTSTDVLRFDRGDLTIQDMRLVLAGTMSDIRKNTVLDLTLGSDSVNIADLFSLIPPEYMKQAEGVKGTGVARVRIAITGVLTDTSRADFSGTISARGARLQYPQLPKPISNITIASSFLRTKTRQEFRIDNLTANLGDAPIRLALTASDFDDPSISLTAGGSLNLATVHEYYPLETGTELSGQMNADIRVNGRVSEPAAMKASGSMEFRDVTAKTPGSAHPVRNLNGAILFNNQALESQRISLALGKSDLTMRFRVVDYLSLLSTENKGPRPRANITLQSNRLYTSDIMSEEETPGTVPPRSPAELPRTGPATGSPKRAPTPKPAPAAGTKSGLPLPDVDMIVTAAIGTLTTDKFVFNNVRGSLKILSGVITMQDLTLEAFGGSVSSRGTLDFRSPERPLFDLSLGLTALQANALLPHFTSFGRRLNGKLTMSTTLKGALDDTLGLVPSALDGAGRVAIQDGTLEGFKVNQALASSLNLPDLETVAFKDWTNTFSVRQGRFVVQDLKISALNADYIVNGSQGLDGTLEYSMTLFLPPTVASRLTIAGFAGEAVNLFKDESGRLKLDFNVGGTIDAPKLQLDTSPARQRAEAMAKQKLQDEKEKLEKSLKEKAGDALKKLLKPK